MSGVPVPTAITNKKQHQKQEQQQSQKQWARVPAPHERWYHFLLTI